MTGLSRTTGRPIDSAAHIRQSVWDILSTPIGSCVLRRDYGSGLFDLIDANINGATLVQIYAAVATALRKWEPRLRLRRVFAEITPDEASEGRVSISLEGEYMVAGATSAQMRTIRMEGLVI